MGILTAYHSLKGNINGAIDYISRALIVKPAEHQMTHEGYHFVAQKFFDAVANGSTAVIRFKTPASSYTHMVFYSSASAGALVKVAEDSTLAHVSDNSVNIINRNRASSNTSDFQEICYNPSGSETGTIIIPNQKIGTSGNPNESNPGENRDANEYVLKPDTVYSVIVTSEANDTDINIGIDWYETGATF